MRHPAGRSRRNERERPGNERRPRAGREIRFAAGFRRTSIGQKRIAVGELFTVFGEDGDSSLDDGDDVREIAHVTTQAA